MRVVRSVSFNQQGDMAVEFTDTDNLKTNRMQMDSILYIPYGHDYDDEIDAVTDAVHAALVDALEDFPHLKVFEPRPVRAADEPDESDDELGAGLD